MAHFNNEAEFAGVLGGMKSATLQADTEHCSSEAKYLVALD